jgi:hypothetical protein
MSDLHPCEHCHRHVVVEETTCPFCGGSLDRRPTRGPARRGHLTRAAVFAGAALLAPAAGCGGDEAAQAEDEEIIERSSGGDTEVEVIRDDVGGGGGDEQVQDDVVEPDPDENVAMPYGAPPSRERTY